MTRNRKSLKTSIVILMFFSLIGAHSIVFYFSHVHIDDNGEFVVHAHPYQKENPNDHQAPNHSHSKHELIFLALFYQSLTQLLVSLFVIYSLWYFKKDLVSSFFFQWNPTQSFFKNISRRGPPSPARFI